MEDISDAINSLLKNPDIMQQVQALSGMIGNEQNTNNKTSNTADLVSLLSGFIDKQNEENPEPQDSAEAPGVNPELIGTISKLAPILSSVKQEDKNTYLLNSLRPFLSDARKKKLDESIKILQLIKIIPLLKDTGILNNLF